MRFPYDKEADDIYLDIAYVPSPDLEQKLPSFHTRLRHTQAEALTLRQRHDTALNSLKKELVIIRII